MSGAEDRKGGLEAEVTFWDEEVFTSPPPWHEGDLSDWVARPRRRFPFWVMDYVSGIETPLLLEVGCGPLPDLEWGNATGLIRASASDPLWATYQALRERFAVEGTVRPLAANAEDSHLRFPGHHFDGVLARNCLDHGEDPRAGFASIRSVLRRGKGLLFFEHIERCGSSCDWADLHQWDLYEEDGMLWAEGPGAKASVRLDVGFDIVDCWRVRRVDGPDDLTHLRVVLRASA